MLNIGETITYNASHAPSNATSPTYSWGVTLLSSGTINGSNTGSSVSITWNEAGSNWVDLTMNNCSSTSVSSSLNVSVSTNCALVTFANITGDSTTDSFGTKTYNVTHDGDGLFTYYWTYESLNNIVTLAGGGSSANVNVNDCGDYLISCTVTNCAGSNVSDNFTLNCNIDLAALIIYTNDETNTCLSYVINITVIGTIAGGTLQLFDNLDNTLTLVGTINNWNGSDGFQYTVDTLLNSLMVSNTICGNNSGNSNVIELSLSNNCA